MKNKNHIMLILLLLPAYLFAQINRDTIVLKEVVVVGKTSKMQCSDKISNSVDEYLQNSQRVSLIKRGAYAWEPLLNNMISERSVVTIDGMRIFGACTDKMDPVSSYVETSNLKQIDIHSGQEGNSCGATIAGAIDLKCKTGSFCSENACNGKFESNIQTGYESNNNHKFYLLSNHFSSRRFTSSTSLSYRKADNYKAGGNKDIKYSQFEKYNISLNLGYKISDKSVLTSNIIFDKALNVGFPALPMDISLAQTLISSLSYKYYADINWLRWYEAKLYHNTITHVMDDTKRAEGDKLPIHMDMPGWSDTYGAYAQAKIDLGGLSSLVKFSGYSNLRTAEMTMYYNSGAKMFMYTWPKVSKQEVSLTMNNSYTFAERQKLKFNMGLSWHRNYVNSDKGLNLNKTFYPNMQREKVRYLPSLSATYTYAFEYLNLSAGLGYGHRAPTITEAYGFYLFNSFDGYDYIGNPNLDNEISNELNFEAVYKKGNFKIETKANAFYIKNYIFGRVFAGGQYQMTPINPKNGLKRYVSLDYAVQTALSLVVDYKVTDYLNLKNSIGYAYGKDNKNRPLPFIRPFTYKTELRYHRANLWAILSINGDTKQTRFSTAYGEDSTPAFTLVNLSMGYKIPQTKINLEVGVENLFDRYYSTYADWKNFPRMGRNIHIGVDYKF